MAALSVLAAFAWDPQVRGFIIVLTAISILIGSVYLILATNTGAKLGFLIAAAGLAGWCAVMGWVWVVYGIGIKGPEPHWVVKEVVTGDVRQLSALDVTQTFPQKWRRLPEGDPVLGDATATADKVLVPQAAAPEGKPAPKQTINVQPPFEQTTDYVVVAGYDYGGEDYFIPGGHLVRTKGFFQGWLHQPHYAVLQVAPVIKVPDLGGAPPVPAPDLTKPPTTVIMIRDLGALRQPSALFALSFSIVFSVVCVTLHRRDKAIMAARAAPAPAGG